MEIPYIVNARKDTGLNNSKIAIWLFLASEVMLFGGLFSSYIFLRIFADYPWPERALPVLPGLINTFILIASSVTVVYAWAALKLRKWPVFVANMSFTLVCAAIFMVFKAKEYSAKLHHQAIQYNDWTTIEGHAHPEKDGHGGNFYSVDADEVTFKLASYYGPYLDTILDRVGDSEIKLKNDYTITKVDGDKFEEVILAKKDTVLSSDELKRLLKKAKNYYIDARTHNQEVRTEALRLAWKNIRKNKDDKFTAIVGMSHHDAVVKDAANAEHSRLVEENATGMLMRDNDSMTISLGGTNIKLDPKWGRMKGSTTEGKETEVKLKDSTSIIGVAADSSIEIDVDAIDFRHMVMKLREKMRTEGDTDRRDTADEAAQLDKAISSSPILNIKGASGDKLRKLWETHKKWRALFAAQLEKDYGSEDGRLNRVPTDVDMYRITWKQFVSYTRINANDELELTLENVKEQQPTMFQGFTGADHKNEEFHKAFTSITVPRDQIKFESVFSPKMNNYYAIYFTITGLHGLHVIGGALVLAYYLFFGYGMYKTNPDWLANRVEIGGLFWHFVDLVWIFVFPIFYLM